ncbi:MAG: four helix bundle protein [Candidatus Marinimicrobia bacterium]|jgi:four helix bundle protein|nr:four helix bundle protein [Candidatus Neomarinimicrobiota bacterium]
MKENLIAEKSFKFAKRIYFLYKFLIDEKKEYILSKQILRSGTSIGANIEEAIGGQSKKDFISKLSIAYKEARETHYWIRLLYEVKIINETEYDSVIQDCEELLKIIGSIQKSTKQNLNS